ncbi:MAG: glycosyltransferase, partial [Halobacteriovoraceae bacterium]|nr:glycosyltransferase [Halobacteriovoraceae bacterium]
MISVIYPLFNETASDWFLRNLQKFKTLNQNSLFDFVFVDGGSSDKTVELCKEAGFNPICLPQSTRSGRLKEGLKHSKGEMVLFHHPRSFISNEGWEELQDVVGNVCWGGFTHKFDIKGPLFKFTSWYSNQVRLKIKGVVYLDHCLFFHQSLLNPEEIMDVPIFEDTLISYKLREKRSPLLLKGTSTTSSIRFKKNGFLNQVLKNQKAKVQFHWKKNFRSINKDYELGLNLNNNEDLIKKYQNPLLTAKGEERASVELSELKTLWFNTGSLCNLECTNCYIESSPKHDRLQYLSINDLTKFLDETKTNFKKLELVGFTGGEPFLNPNI